jgi:hypothetical protein
MNQYLILGGGGGGGGGGSGPPNFEEKYKVPDKNMDPIQQVTDQYGKDFVKDDKLAPSSTTSAITTVSSSTSSSSSTSTSSTSSGFTGNFYEGWNQLYTWIQSYVDPKDIGASVARIPQDFINMMGTLPTTLGELERMLTGVVPPFVLSRAIAHATNIQRHKLHETFNMLDLALLFGYIVKDMTPKWMEKKVTPIVARRNTKPEVKGDDPDGDDTMEGGDPETKHDTKESARKVEENGRCGKEEKERRRGDNKETAGKQGQGA